MFPPQGKRIYVTSHTSTAQIPEPLPIKPPLPFIAKLEVLPAPTGPQQSFLTPDVVSQEADSGDFAAESAAVVGGQS